MSVYGQSNIAGHRPAHVVYRIYLFPGQVWQWFLYLSVSGKYSNVVAQTRTARDPIMTHIFALVFWFFMLGGMFSSGNSGGQRSSGASSSTPSSTAQVASVVPGPVVPEVAGDGKLVEVKDAAKQPMIQPEMGEAIQKPKVLPKTIAHVRALSVALPSELPDPVAFQRGLREELEDRPIKWVDQESADAHLRLEIVKLEPDDDAFGRSWDVRYKAEVLRAADGKVLYRYGGEESGTSPSDVSEDLGEQVGDDLDGRIDDILDP